MALKVLYRVTTRRQKSWVFIDDQETTLEFPIEHYGYNFVYPTPYVDGIFAALPKNWIAV
jgi:hypothetical protein